MISGLCFGIILGWMIRGIYVWRVELRDCVLVPRSLAEDDAEEPTLNGDEP